MPAANYTIGVFVQANCGRRPGLTIAGVHVAGVQKLTGFVSVSAEPGVAIKAAVTGAITKAAVDFGKRKASEMLAGNQRQPARRV